MYDDARARLPPQLRALSDETFRAYRDYWAVRATGKPRTQANAKANLAHRAMTKALECAGLAVRPAVALEALAPVQRGLLVVFSEDEIPIGSATAAKGYARRRRRTLEIEPAGMLEALVDGRPRYLLHSDEGRRPFVDPPIDVSEGLPDDQRVEALVEGLLGGYPGDHQLALELLLPTHAKLAGDYAARTLPTLGHEESGVLHWASAALFTALARSATPVPGDGDRLFSIARAGQRPIPPERVLEHALALPPGRRERAMIGSMARSDGIVSDLLAGVAFVLERQPMPEVLDAAIEHAAKAKKTPLDPHVRQKLVVVERQLLTMKRGAPAKAAAPAAPIVLRVEGLCRPRTVAELDPIRVAQLRIAGDRWEGVKRPAERRLVVDENDEASFGGVCEWRVLADASGKHRYDAWLYAGDSATYFLAGSTRPIAEMLQRSVATLRDQDAGTGLAEALRAASRTEAGVGAPPAVPSAPPDASKKPTSKKPTSKKH